MPRQDESELVQLLPKDITNPSTPRVPREGLDGPRLQSSMSVGHDGKPATYESLDYEEIENTVYRSDKAASSTIDSINYASLKWLVCFLLGTATAVTAFIVNFSVENLAGFKFWATLTLMEKGNVLGSYFTYTSINAVLVIASVAITMWAGPAAVGSGISEVKAYLNGVDVPGIFYLNTLIAKLLGMIGSVAGGLAIGKEGPFVHAGAALAALISQGGPPGYQTRLLSQLWNDNDRADMVTAGGAAGIAAAFRSPVGGVLFALEELSSWWRNQLMWLLFFTTAVVSVTVRVLMKMCKDQHCGFFGSGGFIYFEIQEGQDAYEVYELIPMLLLGVIGGLLGSSFIALNAKLAAWRKKHLAPYGLKGRLLEGLVISVLTSTVSFMLPLYFNCQACPPGESDVCPRRDNTHSGNFVSFGCKRPNQYSDLATLFFNTQDDAIRALFSSRTKREYTVPALVVFATSFYWLAVITYGVSCPTGLFVPSILCGATYGRLVGIFVADMSGPGHIDEGTYALLGAASFLGGSMRITMAVCVMLLELTNNLALLPLIMLVLLVAKAVGDGTGIHPIYEVQMEYKALPFLGPSPDPVMRHMTARECCGRPPVALNRIEKVSRIVETLKSCDHNGFPVMQPTGDGDTPVVGVVLRQHLLRLLMTKTAFQSTPFMNEAANRVAISFNVADFSKPMSTPGLSIKDLKLNDKDNDMYLDLGPYLNPSYYVVQDNASLSKVYTLFRTLGLRHICVVPRATEVVGIISRNDLLPGTIEDQLARGGQYDPDGTIASTKHNGHHRHRSSTRRSPFRVGRTSSAASSEHGGFHFYSNRQTSPGNISVHKVIEESDEDARDRKPGVISRATKRAGFRDMDGSVSDTGRTESLWTATGTSNRRGTRSNFIDAGDMSSSPRHDGKGARSTFRPSGVRRDAGTSNLSSPGSDSQPAIGRDSLRNSQAANHDTRSFSPTVLDRNSSSSVTASDVAVGNGARRKASSSSQQRLMVPNGRSYGQGTSQVVSIPMLSQVLPDDILSSGATSPVKARHHLGKGKKSLDSAGTDRV